MAKLRLLKGRPNQQEFDLVKPQVVLGRSSNCDIQLAREWVSAQHARLDLRDDRYYITDLKSKNDTRLNGRRLEPNVPHVLNHNDLIKICDHLLLYLEGSTDSWIRSSSHGTVRLPLTLDTVRMPDRSDSGIRSSIDSSSGSWEERTDSNPQRKLAVMMKITRSLHDALSMNDMLSRVLDCLLDIFTRATCGVVAVAQRDESVPQVATVRHRDPTQSNEPRIDQSILSGVIASQNGVIAVEEDWSMMCAPLVSVEGQSLGVIQVEGSSGKDLFDSSDLDLLTHVALQTSLSIESIRLHQQVRRDQETKSEMATAFNIQLSLLPRQSPQIDNYAFEDFYSPAREIGGDFYDYAQLHDGRLAIVIGDVAGKGVPAALVVASLITWLKVMLAGDDSPLEVMNRLNSEFESRFGTQLYLTMLVAALEPGTGQLEMINAGHFPPLIRLSSGATQMVEPKAGGLAPGIAPDFPYEVKSFTLEPGDSLVFYTDGITESKNAEGDLYLYRRLINLVSNTPGDAERLCKGILDDVFEFSGDEVQQDDICLLCVSRNEL